MVKRKIIPYFFTYFTKLSWNHSVVRFLFFSDQTFPSSWGFLNSSVGKESTRNVGGPGSIPGSRRSIGEGIGYPFQHSWASLVAQLVKNLPTMLETWVRPLRWKDPLEKGKGKSLQYSGLENSMDCIVHGVIQSWIQLSDFHFHFPSSVTNSLMQKIPCLGNA